MSAGRVLAALLLVFTIPADLSAQPPVTGMGDVDRLSSERSRLRNDERRRRGIIYSGAGPYTVTQVIIPKTDDGSGFYTGTNFVEIIQIMTPYGFDPAGPDLPLILVFNGWGLSAFSFFNGMSDIPDEANARGWLVVAVTCLDDKSYGWIVGQIGVEVALKYVSAHYPVDEDRVYGVGWSAGGGSIASYAARHLDPAAPMLAAIATNAGSYDLVDVYDNSDSAGKAIFEHPNLFQGPPTGATLWNYLRTQTETKNIATGNVIEIQSQMRNLLNTPIYHVYSTDDTIVYLPNQSALLAQYMTTHGADYTGQTFSGLPDPHTWDLLPGPATLSWFDTHTLEREPPALSLSADRSGWYYWAKLTLLSPITFGTLLCTPDQVANHLEIGGVSNLTELRLDPPASQFNSAVDFTLTFTAANAVPIDLVIEDVPGRPSEVLQGSLPFTNWEFNAADGELALELPPGVTALSVVFGDYTGLLVGPASIAAGSNLHFDLAASTPYKPYLLLIGQAAGVVPLSLFDPGDQRDLLLSLNPLPVILPPLVLDAAAEAALDVGLVPAGLAGSTLYCQFLTFPGGATIVDEISNRLDVDVLPGP
ncbi:MAG: hypothetical protein HY812_21025 [Planctomycetes bacterium]|nr:hypothetical protein [Planctomycetota bacterium]